MTAKNTHAGHRRTGARLPGLEPDGKLIWTYTEAMVPEACPSRCWWLAPARSVLNSPVFYNDLGVDVTVVEVVDRILPAEDEEISALAHKAFVKRVSRS